jgi:Fe-S-cluster containining protein
VTTTRVLSVHAAYGCRDSGACCTAGWPIPVEADRLAQAERALAAGTIDIPTSARPAFLRPSDAPAQTPAILAIHDAACVFYRRAGAARCSLQRALGHDALPLACRQFPRISVTDPRGVSITLSHFCPTAAALLDDGGRISIVEDAPAFPAGGEYVGLDVRDALPPALRPDMLMDWESWWLWEAEAVALLDAARSPVDAIARLAVAVEHARSWAPVTESLSDRIRASFETARRTAAPTVSLRAFADVQAHVLDAVPDVFRMQAADAFGRRSTPASPRAHIAFLAAHAFANWSAHLGDDLREWWRSIEAAHVLISSGLSVRDVDLLLRHLADPHGRMGT